MHEQKIKDLDGRESFPAASEELGKENVAGNSVSLLRTQMEEVAAENRRLRASVGGLAHERLRKEKAALEESLRGEILVNEEQRNYIQILKEALELRSEDVRQKDPMRSIGASKSQSDIFVSAAMMKRELESLKAEHKRSEEDVAEMEGLIMELKTETEEQKEQLGNFMGENNRLAKENEELVKEMQEISAKVFASVRSRRSNCIRTMKCCWTTRRRRRRM